MPRLAIAVAEIFIHQFVGVLVGKAVFVAHPLKGRPFGHRLVCNGPVFLEFATYRWREHCGPYYDNDLGYRTESEFLEWRKCCPLETVQNQLLRDGILTETEVSELNRKFEEEMAEAVAFAKESPFPTEKNLMEYVYCP